MSLFRDKASTRRHAAGVACILMGVLVAGCSHPAGIKQTAVLETPLHTVHEEMREVREPEFVDTVLYPERGFAAAVLQQTVYCEDWNIVKVEQKERWRVAWEPIQDADEVMGTATTSGMLIGLLVGLAAFLDDDEMWYGPSFGILAGGALGASVGTTVLALHSLDYPLHAFRAWRRGAGTRTSFEPQYVSREACGAEQIEPQQVSLRIRMHDDHTLRLRAQTDARGRATWNLREIDNFRGGNSLVKELHLINAAGKAFDFPLSTPDRYALSQTLQEEPRGPAHVAEVPEPTRDAPSPGAHPLLQVAIVDGGEVAAGNQNERLDPGERVRLIFSVQNRAEEELPALELQLSGRGAGFQLEQAVLPVDAVSPSAAGMVETRLTVSPAVNLDEIELEAFLAHGDGGWQGYRWHLDRGIFVPHPQQRVRWQGSR